MRGMSGIEHINAYMLENSLILAISLIICVSPVKKKLVF